MDIRGIEVTNQLRSAIRAKLLELGVRYDEELPDYILVMVVNKKTRQQMHEDLHLFLEESTTPFVEWLHDQVLKKLQKVTIAKKKTSREFVPTIVVKQEEERKKRKNNAMTTTAEEQTETRENEKILTVAKVEKPAEKIVEEAGIVDEKTTEETVDDSSTRIENTQSVENTGADSTTVSPKTSLIPADTKITETREKTTKRPLESNEKEKDVDKTEKRIKPLEISEDRDKIEDKSEREDDDDDEEEEESVVNEKRLKSCVNKPTVTSVVSVKTRLGVVSPRKKFETHRANRVAEANRLRQSTRPINDFPNRRDFTRSKSHDEHENHSQRLRFNDFRNRQQSRAINLPRNRQFTMRDDKRFEKNSDNEKTPRNVEKALSVKDRLGTNNKNSVVVKKTFVDEKTTTKDDIKNRLGPMSERRRNVLSRDDSSVSRKRPINRDETRIEEKIVEEPDEEDDDESIVDSVPLKSRIIAINRPEIGDKRTRVLSGNVEIGQNRQDDDDEDEDEKTIASKVIVTPRPLKPLQPIQKRATQSLLLRAVAEANQSVVKQKNPEPVLTDKKPILKRLRPSGSREIGKNLSVHLNATKRLVMEKIQVQLSTGDNEDDSKSKQYTPNPVNDEHMGVVMSLFQRSDDNQKFLVTLNGYNNNIVKDKSLSEEEEERLEMEVTEDDEIVLSNVRNDSSEQNVESSPTLSETTDNIDDNETLEKTIIIDENNENHNIDNVEIIEESLPQRKRRKLSPIVYKRSPSPNVITKILPNVSLASKEMLEKKSIVDVSMSASSDKSREKCRYWPNCTVGEKCAYYHPAVPCSSFPACKYGDKCAYKHPKCKFGLACTKLGCGFVHPKQQCKYHPFCTKLGCPYSHPSINQSVVTTDTTRAKFTWKRRD